jgi:hypothetical protein
MKETKMDWMSFAVGFLANFAVIGLVAVVTAAKSVRKKAE